MRFAAAYALLWVTVVASGLAFARGLLAPTPAFNPRKAHAPCTQTVAGPTAQWACSNGHVYTLQDGHWFDSGATTPAPWTPAA